MNRDVDGNPRTCFDGVDVFDWELETLERESYLWSALKESAFGIS